MSCALFLPLVPGRHSSGRWVTAAGEARSLLQGLGLEAMAGAL